MDNTQTASGRAFKPQWLTAASVQLAAGATRLRAQSVAGGTAKFSGMAALKGRSSAQLLGAYVDPSVGSQKLCLAVGAHRTGLLHFCSAMKRSICRFREVSCASEHHT